MASEDRCRSEPCFAMWRGRWADAASSSGDEACDAQTFSGLEQRHFLQYPLPQHPPSFEGQELGPPMYPPGNPRRSAAGLGDPDSCDGLQQVFSARPADDPNGCSKSGASYFNSFGIFELVLKARVRTGVSMNTARVASIPKGTKVKVVEVIWVPADKRIRGRILDPPGWISIKDTATCDDCACPRCTTAHALIYLSKRTGRCLLAPGKEPDTTASPAHRAPKTADTDPDLDEGGEPGCNAGIDD